MNELNLSSSLPLNTASEYRYLQSNNYDISQTKGAKHLQSMSPLNYVCLALYFILIIGLLYIIKRYFAKYIGFYLIRKDFQRIKTQSQNLKITNNGSCDSHTFSKMTFRQKIDEYKVQIIQNMFTYHPAFASIFGKLKKFKGQLKMPTQINIGWIILAITTLLTFTFVLSKINSSICEWQRSYLNLQYICQNKSQNFQTASQIGLAFLSAILALTFTLLGLKFFSKNYYEFLRQLAHQPQTEQISHIPTQAKELSDIKNLMLPSQQEHQGTLQNMLGDESETTRRSLKHCNLNKASNKNLFQINEDEEEEPFSPQKENFQEIQVQVEEIQHSLKKSVLGENKSILNVSHINNSQNLLAAPKHLDFDYDISDPPQFSSYTKDNQIDESMNNFNDKNHQSSQSQANLFSSNQALLKQKSIQELPQRPQTQLHKVKPLAKSNVQSMSALSDSTATTPMILQDINSQSILNSHKNLPKSAPHYQEERKASQQSVRGEEESSRIMMLPRSKHSSSQSKLEQQVEMPKFSEPAGWKEIVGLIFSIMLIIGSLLFNAYCFYNMTADGLTNALIIFAFSIVIDLIILRPLAISIISIFTLRSSLKSEFSSNIIYDEDQLCLLGSLYETYEQPLNMMLPDPSNTVFISRNSLSQDIESQVNTNQQRNMQQPQERVIQLDKKKNNRNIGEIVLIEATYFYHQPQIQSLKKQENQQQREESKEFQKDQTKQKKINKGEKVECSESITFNAEEMLRIKKSHNEKTNIIEKSHDDIEEIPMYSSRKREQKNPYEDLRNEINEQENAFSQAHQFETPKMNQSMKNVAQILQNGVNISTQQLITFNECRESYDQHKKLKDLALGSIHSNSSKKKIKEQQQFQSIQRYLDDDKENKTSNIKKRLSILKDSIMSSNRKMKYVDENAANIISPSNILQVQNAQIDGDEIINFTPQYNSLSKKEVLGSVKVKKDLFNENRKSLALPEMFSDLRKSELTLDVPNRRKRSKNSSKNSSKRKQEKEGIYNDENQNVINQSNQKVLLASRKSFNSPSSLKENLEAKMNRLNSNLMNKQQQMLRESKPNVSPFNEFKNNLNQEDQHTLAEPITLNPGSPRDFNILSSIDFNQPLQEPPQLRSSVNQNLRSFLQPQLTKTKNKNRIVNNNQKSEMINNQSSKGTLVEETIDQQAKEVINKSKKRNSNKPQIKTKIKQKKQEIVISKNDSTISEQNSMNLLKKIDSEEFTQDQEDHNKSSQLLNQINESREETLRSKMFEDSDSSTFRMISFGGGLGSRQRSKAKLIESQTAFQTQPNNTESQNSESPIDFYSNPQSQAPQINTSQLQNNSKAFDYMALTQEFKKSKKPSVAEIIVEENLVTNNSSPEKNMVRKQIQLQTSSSQDNHLNEVVSNDNDFNMINQIETLQNYENYDPMSDYQMQICQRKSKDKSRKEVREKRNQIMTPNSEHQQLGSYDVQSVNSNLRHHEEQRKLKEEQEINQLRIDEQKRKLKNFLKLARQIKSAKDEKKIKEFLKYLKEVQKPLPMSKINELKSLEMMSSPYNQSLIAMIKDEYEYNQKGNKKQESHMKKPSKSQIRQQAKNGETINKLSGIYGQPVGNQQYLTNKKEEKQREKSAGGEYSTKQGFRNNRNKLMSSRSKQSRQSSNSISDRPPRHKFNNKGNRNLIQVLDTTSNNQGTLDKENVQSLENQNQDVSHYGNTTSDEENDGRFFKMQEFNKRNIMGQDTKQNMIKAIEIQDDFQSQNSEFNEIQNFMD